MTIQSSVEHRPTDPEKFEFDASVANVFDDMAVRSIPMYDEVHKMHVSMFRHLLVPGSLVVDIGASTGKVFREIETLLGHPLPEAQISSIAIDPSEAMLALLKSRHPYVETLLDGIPSVKAAKRVESADLIFCMYVLQFIPLYYRADAISQLCSMVKPGGYIIVGEKNVLTTDGGVENLATEEYYRFREGNGYSRASIQAKTAALKNSMWTVPLDWTRVAFHNNGLRTCVTSSKLQFNTFIAYKE